MRVSLFVPAAAALAAAIVLSASAAPAAHAAPAAQAGCAGNLLQNPGFEGASHKTESEGTFTLVHDVFHSRFACLCCGFLTLDESPVDSYAICPVCFWEADPVQAADLDFAGGANQVSLREARRNFARIGACQRRCLPSTRAAAWHEWPA